MTKINDLSTTLQTLFTNTANELGKKTGFIKRQRKITGAAFAQSLILGGLAKPEATRKEQQQNLSCGGVQMSEQALEQRFSESAISFLRALLEAVLNVLVMRSDPIALLPQFRGVYLTDCSRFTWGAFGFKLGVRWDMQRGQLEIEIMSLSRNDQKTRVVEAPMPEGALHLGDLGFFKLKRFAQWNARGIKWLSRFKVGTKLFTLEGSSP